MKARYWTKGVNKEQNWIFKVYQISLCMLRRNIKSIFGVSVVYSAPALLGERLLLSSSRLPRSAHWFSHFSYLLQGNISGVIQYIRVFISNSHLFFTKFSFSHASLHWISLLFTNFSTLTFTIFSCTSCLLARFASVYFPLSDEKFHPSGQAPPLSPRLPVWGGPAWLYLSRFLPGRP